MRRAVAVAVCAGVCNLLACQILAGLDDPLVPRSPADGGNVGADVGTSADGAPVDGGGSDAPVVLGPPAWRKASTTGPSARHSSTMAFDAVRQRVVLFGGWAGTDDDGTWEWDGANWAQRTLPGQPNGRRGHRMVSDTARNRVFLIGGTRPFPPDQWEWDGVRWAQKGSTNHPPAVVALGLAYDTARSVTVYFGGLSFVDGGTISNNQTWEWSGTDWTQRTPADAPTARRAHAMTYDSARQRVVLFGGSGGGVKSDTWEYDGNNWVERQPITFPTARFGACMAYEPRRRVVVMFGGWQGGNNPASDETWFWDGNDWAPGPKGPTGVHACALAFDPARGNLVLFGGALVQNAGPAQSVSETWVLE